MMKTEKRKANVGERILITGAVQTQGIYGNGDILTVKALGQLGRGVSVEEHGRGIFHSEYEVIVETSSKPKKSARITALETQVVALEAKVEALESAGKYPLTERFERESTSNCVEVDAILADIERKAKPTLEALLATYPPPVKSPNEQRADVIKRAKAFVSKQQPLGGRRVTYVVNAEKRTVVALLHRVSFGFQIGIYARGIAKCDPDDVFNADIGKAIALARALGVGTPEEFVKAVQPTEKVVGMILRCSDNSVRKALNHYRGEGTTDINSYNGRNGRIIEDTDAVYS